MSLKDIQEKGWLSRNFTIPRKLKKVPTMLTSEECMMLTYLGEHYYSGSGHVCDLGSFLGGSTIHLAHGLRKSGKQGQIYAYDRFEIDEKGKEKWLYSKGYPAFEGENMLHVFEQNLSDYSDLIIPRKGDVLNFDWNGDPIEILFIDLSKSYELNDHILKSFFPSLIPGKSIIIQQDYLHFRTPWLQATMEILSNKVEMIAWTEYNSVLYHVREKITQDDIREALSNKLTYDVILSSIENAKKRFPYRKQKEDLDAVRVSFEMSPDARVAWKFPKPWIK